MGVVWAYVSIVPFMVSVSRSRVVRNYGMAELISLLVVVLLLLPRQRQAGKPISSRQRRCEPKCRLYQAISLEFPQRERRYVGAGSNSPGKLRWKGAEKDNTIIGGTACIRTLCFKIPSISIPIGVWWRFS